VVDRFYSYVDDPLFKVDFWGLNQECGIAKIHHFEGDAANPYGHYSIEVTHGSKSMHTHQVITAADYSTTTITRDISMLPVPLKTVEVNLPNANKAMDYQASSIGKELGPYSQRTNSCVDHVAEVIRQGGIDVPNSALGQYKFLKKLGF
jgi:hypothetical protein